MSIYAYHTPLYIFNPYHTPFSMSIFISDHFHYINTSYHTPFTISIISYPFLYIFISISNLFFYSSMSISYPFSIPIYLYYIPFCQDSGITEEERTKEEPKVIDDYKDIWAHRDCDGLHASCASSCQTKM